MKCFEIKTKTKYTDFYFYTRANNGKDALKNLFSNSEDFKQILSKTESNNMKINIKVI